MANKWKQRLCGMLILCIMLMTCLVRTEAAEPRRACKVVSLKQNTIANYKFQVEYNSTYTVATLCDYVYKISVPSGGFIKVQYYGDRSGTLHKKINTKRELFGQPVAGYIHKGSNYFALEKGTYYLHPEIDGKLKWSFVKMSVPSNYCRSKAQKLVAGTKKIVYFDRGYEFARWFKIVLPTSKRLTVYCDNLDVSEPFISHVLVYKANGRVAGRPDSEAYGKADSHRYRTPVLTKGTYYICLSRVDFYAVGEDSGYIDEGGRLVHLYWK